MFWKFDLHSSSHIDTLLEREDVTLKELMDEEDVLQECKAQNRKLIEFLLKAECLEDLVSFIIEEPPQDMDEKIRYKYPNISCELLTSDVSQMNDRLGEDESLLMKLYSFLLNESPLNPLLASFFSKVLSILISRKPEQIVDFLKKKRDFVDLIIKHIGTSAIMDLLLRLLTCIEPPQPRQDVLNWLNEEKIIQRLVEIVHPSQEEDRHSNASQSLCEIIRLSRDQMLQIQNSAEPDPLLATLEKQEIIEQLLSNIFHKEKNESAIVSAIQILLTLLETRRPTFEGHIEICPPGMSHSACLVNKSVLEAIRGRLRSFHELLLEPPKKSVMKTTWGVLDPPVGNTRLNVIRLISSLLQTNTSSINGDLIELNSIGVILDMFFKYTWNNFLHTQVEICVALILASPFENTENGTLTDRDTTGDNLLLKHLFQKCQLIERILEAWEMNEKKQAEGGRRHGYMGHLTRIANCVVHSTDKGPNSTSVQQLIKDLPDEVRERWETFCTSSLGETNKRNTVDLVTTCHIHSSSDDEIDFKETGFSQDSSLQQAFSDYQMQQMTSNFIDQFGFNDEKFADQDDIGNVSFDRVSDINFTLNTNESGNIALFEACCKERIQQFDDGGSDEEDIWEEKHIAFTPESQRRSSVFAWHKIHKEQKGYVTESKNPRTHFPPPSPSCWIESSALPVFCMCSWVVSLSSAYCCKLQQPQQCLSKGRCVCLRIQSKVIRASFFLSLPRRLWSLSPYEHQGSCCSSGARQQGGDSYLSLWLLFCKIKPPSDSFSSSTMKLWSSCGVHSLSGHWLVPYVLWRWTASHSQLCNVSWQGTRSGEHRGSVWRSSQCPGRQKAVLFILFNSSVEA
ncbi:serine/threonine-protein phosphatase 6 regulatory subunit 3 isoform 3-T7 [Trichechus inunguis]